MFFEFKLPDIGEGVVDGEIVRWMVQPGDQINEDQPMVEIMTDKATVEIPSPREGTVVNTNGEVGEIVKVGATLVVIEEEGTADTSKKSAELPSVEPADPLPESASEKATVEPTQETSEHVATKPRVPVRKRGERALASPATRKLARELGVDVEKVPGTGSRGRVTSDDVRLVVAATTPIEELTPFVERTPGKPGSEERIPLRGLRKQIAERMTLSKFTATHFTYVDEVDVTELVKVRDAAEPKATQRGLKLSYLPFIIKGVIFGLQKFPLMNATLDETRGEIVLKKYYNIGIAVATDGGLIVPVIKDADRKSVFELASEIQSLGTAAREGKTKLEELQDGTFTITSLGAIGGLLATPIINFPEVAILGIHKIESRPVVREGNIVARDMMNVSVSLDHRIVDGVVAAQFVQELFRYLKQPGLLFPDRF